MEFKCEICGGTDTEIVNEPSRYTVEGETFEIPDQFRKCKNNCGFRVPDEKYDDISLNKLIAAKRTRGVRMKLDLTQSQMAILLGWGPATVQRYEGGQTNPNANHLHELDKLYQSPAYAFGLLMASRDRLEDQDFTKLQRKLQPFEKTWLEDPYNLPSILLYYQNLSFKFTGERMFDPRKLVNMALYFTQTALLKTKLMKFLWYADYLHYKLEHVSISGTPYQNQKYGPVPFKHGALLDEMVDRNVLHYNIEEINTYTHEEFTAKYEFDPTLFTVKELQCMENVKEQFSSKGSSELSEISHKEDAWKNTDRYDIIPYKYAEQLRAIEV